MGFAVWIDSEERVAWARGTHEYRPMGIAVVAVCDQFRQRDFVANRNAPTHLGSCFAGFFGSLETVNDFLRSPGERILRRTPPHLLGTK
jgi:hypothetical protein